MNNDFPPVGAFERRRLNRAILIVIAMAIAGIALNDGVHAFMSRDGDSRPSAARSAPGSHQPGSPQQAGAPC